MSTCKSALALAAFTIGCTTSACLVYSACADEVAPESKPASNSEYQKTVSQIDYRKRTISLADFKTAAAKPGTVILDLRSENEYKSGHIKNAVNVGADITAEKLKKLSPDKKSTIVVYCTNSFFPTRRFALTAVCLPQIIGLGYSNAYVLEQLWHRNLDDTEKFKKSELWVDAKASK
jgi:hypothetical protein